MPNERCGDRGSVSQPVPLYLVTQSLLPAEKEEYLAVISLDVSCGGKLPDVMCDNTGFDGEKCY